MLMKEFLSKWIAKKQAKKIKKCQDDAIKIQHQLLHHLIQKARKTKFGKDHLFTEISSYEDFKNKVPIRDYETLKPYIEDILKGKFDILWTGKPLYFAKTSGTTSGVKYIPISKDSMPEHIRAARNALLAYIHETGKTAFLTGKMIFLQGSPLLESKAGIQLGRLSGIVAHHVPKYLQKNRMPSYTTNCIEDWEQKVDAIVAETKSQNMTLISGIPPWVQMYFDKLSQQSGGEKIGTIFKNFELFVYGGVNFEPYRAKLLDSIGRQVDTVETYPASEGFIAYQDLQPSQGLLLSINSGMFYEFIPVEEYFNEKPTRLSIGEVEVNKNYALILTTNAGLWAYSIGDTIKFVSKKPYRIVVTGRIKHFISAFGEHVIGEEVEHALMTVAKQHQVEITEFTVAPQVNPVNNELPYHEWLIEFSKPPIDLIQFACKVDAVLQQKNSYYADLIEGKILQTLKINMLKPGAFINYMRTQGKLGGQNKVPRLSNDRVIADALSQQNQQ